MLGLNPVQWFINFPPEVAVFWLSMIPITELRASIPIGIEAYGLPVWKTWLIAVVGDMLPALFILGVMPYIHDWVVRRRFFGPILTKKLEQAESTFSGKYAKYGALGLIIFVGIPLPFTGSWTGSLASFVFKIPFCKAAILLLAGVSIAATIVTLLTLGAGETVRFFW